MAYQALYRAWRPPSFADMVHQPHVKQTLQNAVSQNRVAHAYLFCGPRGTGKTSAAKILAKAVNCLHPVDGDPCNVCVACQSINNASAVDVVEIDAASNRGVEEIRQLRDNVQYAPAGLTKKVYIVDEVHMLTPEAFNALLKTLEEPPMHVMFILATTEPHKLPETIISRCQRFDFRRIPDALVVDRLLQICETQGWTYESDALWHIAAAADGGLRDALGLLEQTAAFAGQSVTADAAAHVVGGVATSELVGLVLDVAGVQNIGLALNRLEAWHLAGKDPGRVLAELLQLLRDLFIYKLGSGSAGLRFHDMEEAISELSVDWLLHAVKQLGELYAQMRYVDQPRIALEAAIVGLAAVSPPPLLENRMGQTETTGKPKAERVEEPAPTSAAPHEEVPAANSAHQRTQRERRKREVLQSMVEHASPRRFEEIIAKWNDVLQQVKLVKIQTYAWLMGGQPVMATDDTVLVTFRVQIHRDNVMKSEERALIEDSLLKVMGISVRFQAILQSDWETHQERAQPEAVPPQTADWVHQVVEQFGNVPVEVRPDE